MRRTAEVGRAWLGQSQLAGYDAVVLVSILPPGLRAYLHQLPVPDGTLVQLAVPLADLEQLPVPECRLSRTDAPRVWLEREDVPDGTLELINS